MSCHIVMSAGPLMRAFCGRNKFGDDPKDNSYHSYVEVLAGKRMYMATCKDCRRAYHEWELEKLEEE